MAFQIGMLVAIERNRRNLTQEELAAAVGMDQVGISYIENGQPVSKPCPDNKIDALFSKLSLKAGGVQANFVKWWRDNGASN